jgi:hypothetical protein
VNNFFPHDDIIINHEKIIISNLYLKKKFDGKKKEEVIHFVYVETDPRLQ